VKKFMISATLITGLFLTGCASSGPQAGEERTQEACPVGHFEDDWDNKKVKNGTKRESYRSNGKTKYRTVNTYETKRVYDGQDWICDVPPVEASN
jgi:hypothetical protein